MRNLNFLILFTIVLSSCHTQVIEYPQFYFFGNEIQKVKNLNVPKFEFNDYSYNSFKEVLYTVVDSSKSEYFTLNIFQHQDTIHIILDDIELSSAINLSVGGNLGIISHETKLKPSKYIFLPINYFTLQMVNKTSKRYTFKPLYMRLPEYRYVGFYDTTTHIDGYIIENHFFVTNCLVNNDFFDYNAAISHQ